MKQKISLVIFGLVLLLAEIVSMAYPAAAASEHIVIFHLNDLHGKIDSLAKVAWLIGQERAKNPDVFFFSAGDNFSGNPIVDQYQPKGQPILKLYDRIGLTVMALGNHEFDYGQEILAQQMRSAKYRFVCANLKAPSGSIPQPPPYITITTAAGIKMALLGLIQVAPESGIPDTHPDKAKGIRFEEPIAAARRYAFLKEKHPLFIALTHIGFDQDVLLAQALPQLDLIVGGHSHTVVLEPKEFGGVLITQAGSNGQYLGRIDLVVQGGRLVSKKATLIDLKAVSGEEEEVKKMIAAYNDNPEMNRVLFASGVVLSGKDELGSLMADAVCREMGLEIAFQNNGGIRSDELPAVIRLKNVYQLDPFGNQVVRFSLTVSEIRSLIRAAFEKGKEVDLQVSGLLYTVVQGADGRIKEIILKRESGEPLEEKRSYLAGLSSYVASAYAFDHKDSGESLFVTTSDCLIRFLEKKPDLSRYRGIVRARLQAENQPQAKSAEE